MNQPFGQQSRLILLKSCALAVAINLVYLISKPSQDKFFELPNVSQWNAITTKHVKDKSLKLDTREYQNREEHNLSVKVSLDPTFQGGNLSLIKSYLGFDLKPQDLSVVEDEKLGHYGLFVQDKTAYLSTCIHSQGKTAFTLEQFSKLANHNLRDRIFPWIFGLSDLRDWRCFWVNTSVDLAEITELEANVILKNKLSSLMSESTFRH